jgi:uncharacterized protein (TIGR04255 family)
VSNNLPRYAKPPVVEVVISVQFDEMAVTPIHFGLFWEHVRERYPRTEFHPPLGSVVELFGTQGAQRASLEIESGFPLARGWYLSEDGLRLVQLQRDRFILNWRKLDTDASYPSYDALRELFERELSVFLDFASEMQLGDFEPTQCELTYVNHIFAGQQWKTLGDLSDVVSVWSGRTADASLPDPEDVRLAWQYRFDERGKPLGRLHVKVQSAFRTSDRLPVIVLQLLGRGAPVGSGVEGVLAFADRAHEWIVRGFTALTTERMHAVWERQQ